MNPLKALYHTLVPHAARQFAAEKRSDLARWAANPHRGRILSASAWAALGRPVRPVRTRFGTLFVDVRDRYVGRPIYLTRTYSEVAEIRFLQDTLTPGMTYLDVGANIGFMVAVAASRVGTAGRIIAIEPEPDNFALLSRAVRANGWAQATPVNVAAGAEPGTARLFKSAHNHGDHRLYTDREADTRAAVDVPVVRLDALFAERQFPLPDFIKIDVQGYEHFVVRGMSGLLAGDRSLTVLSEFWPHGISNAGGDPQAYLDLFRAAGLHVFRLDHDGKPHAIEWADVWGLIPPLDPAKPDWAMTNLVFARGVA